MKAMETELDILMEMSAFVVVDRKKWMNVVSSVWAFKRKRYPDGSIRKLMARICARGFEQIEGVDYFETFAPGAMDDRYIDSNYDNTTELRKQTNLLHSRVSTGATRS
jgi:hypothetical protein